MASDRSNDGSSPAGSSMVAEPAAINWSTVLRWCTSSRQARTVPTKRTSHSVGSPGSMSSELSVILNIQRSGLASATSTASSAGELVAPRRVCLLERGHQPAEYLRGVEALLQRVVVDLLPARMLAAW